MAADAVVVVHGLFILFVLVGGFLTWRWRWVVWVHLPTAVYGALDSDCRGFYLRGTARRGGPGV